MNGPPSTNACETTCSEAKAPTRLTVEAGKRGALFGSLLAIAGAAAAACGGEPSGGNLESLPPLPGSESVGTTSSALNAAEVCSLVNALGTALQTPPVSGVFNGHAPTLDCAVDEINHTYYNGAELLTISLQDLFNLPYVTTGAYLCGVADASGAKATAVMGGGFGIESQFNVTQRDPAHGHVAARRVGTVYLFGVGGKLVVQDIDWLTLPETATNSTPPWWGAYAKLRSQGIRWNFDADLSFRIGTIVVRIVPSIHSRGPTVTRTNNAIFFDPTTNRSPASTNQLAPTFDFNRWLGCGQNGAPLCPRSDVSNTLFLLEHLAPCASGDPNNLNDGFLPYYSPFGGASCASQNFIFPDVLQNWFQFGRPSAVPGKLLEDEPNHNLTSTTDIVNLEENATFWSNVKVSTAFDVGVVKIALDATAALAVRDGFALRQQHTSLQDFGYGRTSTIGVRTDLNSQAKATLDINGTIEVSSLIPPFTFHFRLLQGDTGNVEARPVTAPNDPAAITDLQYNDIDDTHLFTALNQYQVNGVSKSNPDIARLQCVTAPATNTTAVSPDNPAGYLKEVAKKAVDTVHPCRVKVCKDKDHETDYEWDSANKNLKAGVDFNRCSVCYKLQMSLCDAAEKELTDTTGAPVRFQKELLSPPADGCLR